MSKCNERYLTSGGYVFCGLNGVHDEHRARLRDATLFIWRQGGCASEYVVDDATIVCGFGRYHTGDHQLTWGLGRTQTTRWTNESSKHNMRAHLGLASLKKEANSVKVVYIDTSESTIHMRDKFNALASRYHAAGWEVFVYAGYVEHWTGGKWLGGPTHTGKVVDHLEQFCRVHGVEDVLMFTDGDIPPTHEGALYRLGVEIRVATSMRDVDTFLVDQRPYAPETGGMLTSKSSLGMPATLKSSLLAFKEAPVNTKPTVVTTVNLSNPSSAKVFVSDLKSLIAEVERVGGDDSSEVRFDRNAYCWSVDLSIKANEVEREVTLSDEERLAALDELAGKPTKTRAAELKKLLGLS